MRTTCAEHTVDVRTRHDATTPILASTVFLGVEVGGQVGSSRIRVKGRTVALWQNKNTLFAYMCMNKQSTKKNESTECAYVCIVLFKSSVSKSKRRIGKQSLQHIKSTDYRPLRTLLNSGSSGRPVFPPTIPLSSKLLTRSETFGLPFLPPIGTGI